MALMVMRCQFLWRPFHPAGYAVSSNYAILDQWTMFFLGWLIKWLVLRHGGLKLHRQVIPLFFGMILGEFAVGGFWALIGIVFRTQTYNFTAWWQRGALEDSRVSPSSLNRPNTVFKHFSSKYDSSSIGVVL